MGLAQGEHEDYGFEGVRGRMLFDMIYPFAFRKEGKASHLNTKYEPTYNTYYPEASTKSGNRIPTSL